MHRNPRYVAEMPSDTSDPASGDGRQLTTMPAVELARLVRDRNVSAVDVVRAHVERIAAVDRELGAFQEIFADQAIAEAEALSARTDLNQLPLAGVPVAIKDNVDVAGAPTRHGSAATPDQPAAADDELVRRLRAAGCVVVGKTQLPELAIWPFTEPAAFRPARNPWDPTRTTGGSSGGSAVAVATGMAALALGSDGGGSIRIPAACCGLFGIKPTPGVVPLAGGQDSHWYGLTAFGPLARTVADAALMLDVLAGTQTYRDPRPPERPLRIAYSARHPTLGARVDPAIRSAIAQTVASLREAGHTLVESRPPYPPDLGLRFSNRWLAGIAQDAEALPLDKLEPRTRNMVRRGQRVARRVKPAAADPFNAAVTTWFEDYDAFLTPTLGRPAPPIGNWTKGWVRTMLGVANWIATPPWNLAGLPAASIPFGAANGLPIGLQLVGRRNDETTILSLAAQLEALQPWPQTAPDRT
jgi:amidase